MLNFIKTLSTAIITTVTYWWSTAATVLWHARIIPIVAIIFLANDQITIALNCLWEYLVANSFCPWIMIFRGRSSSAIIIEAATHVNSITAAADMNGVLAGVYGVGSAMAELIGGPALGIAITAAFVFISYKCIALIFSKLFNRK